jgi:diguanylate cyclase (GGDEF)-like protein
LDDHEAEYWARQVRVGSCIAGVITIVGGARVALDWAVADRWWLIPVLIAGLVQGALALLPWNRYIRQLRVRRLLVIWWVAELPVLYLFAQHDSDGLLVYTSGSSLVLVLAAALFSPSIVVGLGVLSVAGFLALLPFESNLEIIGTLGLLAIMASLVGVNAIIAHNRGRLDARRRAAERRLSHQAFTDSLTGLANRALFQERLADAVAARNGRPVTVVLIDLDDFKNVNDDLGHTIGDDLLVTVAQRLGEQVRPGDTLARLGGDEFALLLGGTGATDSIALAGRLLDEIGRPVRLASRDLHPTASIGLADTTGDPEHLLRNADLAMYAAKRSGRNTYAVFDAAMYATVLQEAQQRAEMEVALRDQQFVVHYQPVVDLPTARMTGVEALVRWQHPVRGLLAPAHFIHHAESSGLIVPLGTWVLREACRQLAHWQRDSPGATGLRMNVNLSIRQFQHAGLVDDVALVLSDTGIDPAGLTLEITESMLVDDIDAALDVLRALRALGVRLAIDDFGTGYSSLSYLQTLPVDTIKIDRSFVEHVATRADSVALVEAVAHLGQALGLHTVAEGIEDTAQRDVLVRLGCQYGQGYLFGKPQEPDEIAGLLAVAASLPLDIVHPG